MVQVRQFAKGFLYLVIVDVPVDTQDAVIVSSFHFVITVCFAGVPL